MPIWNNDNPFTWTCLLTIILYKWSFSLLTDWLAQKIINIKVSQYNVNVIIRCILRKLIQKSSWCFDSVFVKQTHIHAVCLENSFLNGKYQNTFHIHSMPECRLINFFSLELKTVKNLDEVFLMFLVFWLRSNCFLSKIGYVSFPIYYNLVF